MADFDQQAYVEGLRDERTRVAGEGDKDRLAQIDAEIKAYAAPAAAARESTTEASPRKRSSSKRESTTQPKADR